VLDPFAGGGAIPLEALRLGCETYALDYNPVAVLLNKAVLEYPQQFGHAGAIERVPLPPKRESKYAQPALGLALRGATDENPLLEAVKAWGDWVLQEARQELQAFYPADPDGSIPVGYIWARTLPCQNPACGAEIPLMRQTWLARKERKKVALRLMPNPAAKRVDAEIVQGAAINFDPEEGTVARAHVRCPLCGGTIDDKTTRRLFREGHSGQRLMAVVLAPLRPRGRGVGGEVGKRYRLPTPRDVEVYHAAAVALEAKRLALREAWGVEPVPDEMISTPDGKEYRTGGLLYNFTPVVLYRMTRWGDLFNVRQKLALITFAEKVRLAHAHLLQSGATPDFATAVTTYLALALSRLCDRNSVLCRVIPQTEAIGFTFGRQALSMLWDFVEMQPFAHASGWASLMGESAVIIEQCSSLQGSWSSQHPRFGATVSHGSATELPWPDDFFDAVLTDPPYYDNVPYSNLSDFFYVWLKRAVGDAYPGLMATPLTPKSLEIIDSLELLRGMPKAKAKECGAQVKDKHDFAVLLTRAFSEIGRVLTPNGIAVIVFAHKTTAAWETVINALLNAGLYMTASWPIHTEMQARMRAQESAALASSVYMLCRKRATQEVGEFVEVRREIDTLVRQKLAQFWDEGIRGADFFMSAIGPAVEAFGRYARVEKQSGEVVTVAELLEYVHQVVSEFALQRILQSAELGGVDTLTRFYLLWRWTYNAARVPYDEARKLATGVGVELNDHWGPGGLVEKQKEYVLVRTPRERAQDAHFAKQTEFRTMVDALQRAVDLWEKNQPATLQEHLGLTYGGNEAFWQVAQAIAEVLPEGEKEKQSLQGLLYGRKGYAAAVQRAFEG